MLFNKKNSSQIMMFMMLGLALFVVLSMFMKPARARYMPSKPVKVTGPKSGSIFDLPVTMDCVAGPSQTASPYSIGLTPGGLCGVQEFVANQHTYEMSEDSVGGTLI
jgi:hypothetical protein